MYPNRYICTVLDEMRNCLKTNNFSYLGGLIEEAQTLANRMEAKLEDREDVATMLEDRDKLYEELKELRKQRAELKAS